MLITSQGFGHFTKGLNNQDFGIETLRMVLVLDGCSEAKYSEIGTRLFAQLFLEKEECDKVEKFENNVRLLFEDIIGMMSNGYPSRKEFEERFIIENLLFTIIACFETEDQFIVKLFGDGYIITQNLRGLISYMKFSYGKCPPYFAYKYCSAEIYKKFHNYEFKTFLFDKTNFSKVFVATDGVLPFVKGDIPGIDDYISKGDAFMIGSSIKSHRQSFGDDVTIAMVGGESL